MSPRHGGPDGTRTQAMPAVRVPLSPAEQPAHPSDVEVIARALRTLLPNAVDCERVAQAALAALQEAAHESCTCYPGGFTPETYEGPQPWCRTHGDPEVAWDQGVAEGIRQGQEAERLRLGLRPDGTPWTTQ